MESLRQKMQLIRFKEVTDVFGPSDVYGIRRLTDKDTILMRGAVTATLEPDSSFVDSKNDPMQPLAWLHPYTAPNGKGGVTFCTTMGASVDLVSEDLRRMIVGTAYFLTGQRFRITLMLPMWIFFTHPFMVSLGMRHFDKSCT